MNLIFAVLLSSLSAVSSTELPAASVDAAPSVVGLQQSKVKRDGPLMKTGQTIFGVTMATSGLVGVVASATPGFVVGAILGPAGSAVGGMAGIMWGLGAALPVIGPFLAAADYNFTAHLMLNQKPEMNPVIYAIAGVVSAAQIAGLVMILIDANRSTVEQQAPHDGLAITGVSLNPTQAGAQFALAGSF